MSDSGKPLRLDPKARSANPAQPPSSRDPPLHPRTMASRSSRKPTPNGWVYGAITDFEAPEGADAGDGYVPRRTERRAGLVWEVGLRALELRPLALGSIGKD